MAAEKTKKETTTNAKTTKVKSKQQRSKKEVWFYGLLGVLGVLTVLLAYDALDYFYLAPAKLAGNPLYGYRTENLVTVEDSMISSTRTYGLNQSGVAEVDILVNGPIIYIDVRVTPNTDLTTAQASAEKISDYLIDEINKVNKDAAKEYNFQLVVSSGDLKQLVEENRVAELEHIKENDIRIVEEVVAYAEEYPTAANIARAKKNIELILMSYPTAAYTDSANRNIKVILESYLEEAEKFQARVDQLDEYTAEEEEALGEIPTLTVDKNVPTSTITADGYPSWATIDTETNEYIWK